MTGFQKVLGPSVVFYFILLPVVNRISSRLSFSLELYRLCYQDTCRSVSLERVFRC